MKPSNRESTAQGLNDIIKPFGFFPSLHSAILNTGFILNLVPLAFIKWMPLAMGILCLCHHPSGKRGKSCFLKHGT